MTFAQCADKLGWKLFNINPGSLIGLPCIDSRNINVGEIFWALKGERDGGEFVSDAITKGAQAAVITAEWKSRVSKEFPLVIVDDVLKALTDYAKLKRDRFKGKVLAITGSCGKTTVKELIYSVLSYKYNVLKNPASYNNHIGLPYTVCQLDNRYDMAVVEMGANHPGEIAELCDTARPDAGLITMIGRAHLEGFGDMAGIAAAKGEIYQNLQGDKIAFVNFDDAYVVGQSKIVQKRIGFGFNFPPAGQGFARIYRGNLYPDKGFSMIDRMFHFPQPEFMIYNGLAAAVIGHFYGVPSASIEKALAGFTAVKGRMKISVIKGITVIDDTYNANPTSMKAALEYTAGRPESRKFAVLGDMMELGEFTKEEHERLIKLMKELEFQKYFTYGKAFSEAPDSNNLNDFKAISDELVSILEPGDVVLFKGSRAMKIEEITENVIHALGENK